MSDRITSVLKSIRPSPSPHRAANPGGGGPAPAWPSTTWWEGFQSPELDTLIVEAETQNYNIQGAIAAVSAADAAVRVAGGALLPNLTASPSASFAQVNESNGSKSGFGAVASSNGTVTQIGQGIVDTRTYSAELSASLRGRLLGQEPRDLQSGASQRRRRPLCRQRHRTDHRQRGRRYLVLGPRLSGRAGRGPAQPRRGPPTSCGSSRAGSMPAPPRCSMSPSRPHSWPASAPISPTSSRWRSRRS